MSVLSDEMSKPAWQKDLLLRLEKLERSMKKKDDELRNLRTELRSTKKQFTEELATKDLIITELFVKIENITSPPQNVDSTSEVVPSNDTSTSSEEPTDSVIAAKIEKDLLVIGDSLVRDLDVSVLNPGGDATVSCLPGARPRDVVRKFRQLTTTHRYKRVIVHVGSNLVPKFSRDTCSARIIDCMESIRELAPESKLAYSSVLPKLGDHLIQGINQVNFDVIRSGKMGPNRTRFGHISHGSQFTTSASGAVDRKLFKRDGIHLTDNGRIAFTKSLSYLVKKL
jgi:hypothetical protein